MPVIDQDRLKQLALEAQESPRLRKNLNLHPNLEAAVQRLFNAMEPGTYIRPHRHNRDNGWELMLATHGAFSIVLFSEEGTVTERVTLSPSKGPLAFEIPPRTLHTVVSHERGTMMFEIKEGPYRPLDPEDLAPWAPAEGDPFVAAFMAWILQAEPGDQVPTRPL